MKCEVCKTIARLGLDDSAHDLWYCADAGVAKTTVRRSRSFLQHIKHRASAFARSHSRHYRMLAMAYRRRSLVTLGI